MCVLKKDNRKVRKSEGTPGKGHLTLGGSGCFQFWSFLVRAGSFGRVRNEMESGAQNRRWDGAEEKKAFPVYIT